MSGLSYSAQNILKTISGGKRVLIVTHMNPDGDAIGSSMGLYHFLKSLGARPEVVIPNQMPGFLKWMPESSVIKVFTHNNAKATEIIQNSEIIFFLDFNSADRTGEMKEYLSSSGAFRMLIDHHPGPDVQADFVMSDVNVSSTAELIYLFIEWLGQDDLVSPVIAECLYAGIMTDTGCFSYNSSQPETYRVLSKLLEKGIDKDKIYDNVYDNFSEKRMRLLGYCLDSKMVVMHEYKTAYISLSKEEKEKYSYAIGDSEGFVNYPLSIKGIKFAAFFMENERNIKLSFRSKGSFSVNDFSRKHFSGGGHFNAAGGESELSLEETIRKFRSLLPQYFKSE